MKGSSALALPPVRSISLPSRLHPTSLRIEAELNKLRKWEVSSVSTIEPLGGAETIQKGLVGLAELYNCVEELIQSQATHQALLQHQDGKLVLEEALDRSVTLLDVCGTARDMLVMMREHVQVLQSALRRRGGGESSIGIYIGAYIRFRKKVIKKEILKCIRALKRIESKNGSCHLLELREVSTITVTVFRSLLLFLSMPTTTTKTKHGGWSLISKVMPKGLVVSGKEKEVMNELGSVDTALCTLHGHLKKNDFSKAEVPRAHRKLESLAVSIDGLEAGLDCMFKCLIQYRVSLLNILTH